MKDHLDEDHPDSFDIGRDGGVDDTPCIPRACFHCGEEILVSLRKQTRSPPDSPFNFCENCLRRICDNDPTIRENFRDCGYFPY